MIRHFFRSILLIFIASAFLFSSTANAQTMQSFEEYGVGPRDCAMGNAFTAVADTYAAAFYNPAGSSWTKDLHMAFGYKFLKPEVNAKLPGFGKDKFTRYPQTNWGLFGFTTDFDAPELVNPKITDPFSLSIAIAISDFIHSYTNYYSQFTPYYFRYQDRPVALMSAYFSAGIKFTNWFSIGAGLVIAPSITHVDAKVRTDVYLPEGEFVANQGTTNRAYSIVDPLAGIMFRIPIKGDEDKMKIGVSWRDAVRVIDGNGVALNRLIIHAPGTDQTLEPVEPQAVPVKTMSGFSPTQVTLGISAKPYKGMLIAGDTIWKQWSKWESYFYNKPDPPFKDTFQQRLGFEQKFFSDAGWLYHWALRAGWYYQPTPVPNQDNEWNILDNDKHVVTGGAGIQFDKVIGLIKTPVDLDFGFQAHYLVPKTIDNDLDPSFPEIRTSGMVYTGTVAIEFTW